MARSATGTAVVAATAVTVLLLAEKARAIEYKGHWVTDNADGSHSVMTVIGDEHASYYAEHGTKVPVRYNGHFCDGSEYGRGHTVDSFTPLVGGCCQVAAGRMGLAINYPDVDARECATLCTANVSCTGYETYQGNCETHFTPLSPADTALNRVENCLCFEKQSLCKKPHYMTPDATVLPDADILNRHLWALLPAAVQSRLTAQYPTVLELTETIADRLESLLDDDAVIRIWDSYADGLPKVAELFEVLSDDIAEVTVGDRKGAEWLIGHRDCVGSLADRKQSTDPRCSSALLTKYAELIRPDFHFGLSDHVYNPDTSGKCCNVTTSEDPSANTLIYTVRQSDVGLPPGEEGLEQLAGACERNCTAYGEEYFRGSACCSAFDIRFDGSELICQMYTEYYLNTAPSTAAPATSITACPGGEVDAAFCPAYSIANCSSPGFGRFCPAMCGACPSAAPTAGREAGPVSAPAAAPLSAAPSAAPTKCHNTDAGYCADLLTTRSCQSDNVATFCQRTCGCGSSRLRLRRKLRRSAAAQRESCRACYTREDPCPTSAPSAASTQDGVAGSDAGRRQRSAHEDEPMNRVRRTAATIIDYATSDGLNDTADYRVRRQLVIPIRFSDDNEQDITPIHEIRKLLNTRGGGGMSPSGSVRDYFLENSYHKADTISTLIPEWVTLPYDNAYYAGGESGKTGAGAIRACEAMFTAIAHVFKKYEGIKWEQFTHPGVDGAVDDTIYEIMFFHSGFPAEHGEDPLDRMWSHQNSFTSSSCSKISILPNGTVRPHEESYSAVTAGDGSRSAKDFLKYNITHSDDPNRSIKIKGYLLTNGCFANRFTTCHRPRIGVIVHELGHSKLHGVKIKDYYESVQNPAYANRFPGHCGEVGSVGNGIGTYGIMGDSWGVCGDQFWVPHFSAWSKIQLGWMKPIDAPYDGSAAKFVLYPSEQCPDVVRVSHNYQHTQTTADNPNGFEEFLLLEQKAAVGVDSTQDRAGVTILHVDEDKANQNYHPNWLSNSVDEHPHYYLKVEQADGKDDLECGTDKGESDDLLTAGASLSSNTHVNFNTQSYGSKQIPNATHNTITIASYTQQNGAFGTGNIATVDVTNAQNGPVAASAPTNGYNPTCIAGQYSTNTGTCQSCPIGKYNPHAASATSVACNSACQVCPDGKYSDASGATACTACPAGKYDAIIHYPNNAASCWDCATRATDWGGNAGLDPISHETEVYHEMLDPIYDETEEYCRNGMYATEHREWVKMQLENGGECEVEYLHSLTTPQILYVVFGVFSILLMGCFWSLFVKTAHETVKKKKDLQKDLRAPRRETPGHAAPAPCRHPLDEGAHNGEQADKLPPMPSRIARGARPLSPLSRSAVPSPDGSDSTATKVLSQAGGGELRRKGPQKLLPGTRMMTLSKSTLSKSNILAENDEKTRRYSRSTSNLGTPEMLSPGVQASTTTVTPEQISAAEHKGWSATDIRTIAARRACGMTPEQINVLKVNLAADAEERRQFAKRVAADMTDVNTRQMIQGEGFGGRDNSGVKLRQAMKKKQKAGEPFDMKKHVAEQKFVPRHRPRKKGKKLTGADSLASERRSSMTSMGSVSTWQRLNGTRHRMESPVSPNTGEWDERMGSPVSADWSGRDFGGSAEIYYAD